MIHDMMIHARVTSLYLKTKQENEQKRNVQIEHIKSFLFVKDDVILF